MILIFVMLKVSETSLLIEEILPYGQNDKKKINITFVTIPFFLLFISIP